MKPVEVNDANFKTEVIDAQTPVLEREEQFTNHRGEKVRVLTSKIPYRDEQGKIAGLICISRIIGERK